VLRHPGERWGKDKKKIEKEREKREAYISTMALSSFSPLFSQNLSDSSSASASYYGISRTT
jgi:hypothetical protein